MADFVFKTRKQYWSAINNMRDNINNNTDKGKALRKQFARISGEKIYEEKNWQKRNSQGTVISKSEFRKTFAKIKKESNDNLKKSWKEEKAKGNKITWKKYRSINSQPDYQVLKESYNSPG